MNLDDSLTHDREGLWVDRLRRVPLRDVWPHEAADFTTWLQENLDILNEHLDTQLESAEREQSAGTFNVDLVAEDERGETVIIENQLEKTDHDHLGKVLTYLTAFDADRAIWISADPRPEHVKAIAWLNDSTPASFHLFKVEAVKIGTSAPAPLLTPIVGPSLESKRIAQSKKESGERHRARFEYWAQLLSIAGEKTKLHANVSPSQHPYISTGAGISGLSYQYWVRQHDARLVLWIDRGKENNDLNQSIFDQLMQLRSVIEESYGEPLMWEPMVDARSCKIVSEVAGAPGWRTPADAREDGMTSLVDAMVRFSDALGPRIAQLDTSDVVVG